MIEHLKSYHLRDFLLFSREALFAINEQYNQMLWPSQIVFLTIGLLCFYFLIRPTKNSFRFLFSFLALSYFQMAYFYHHSLFSSINWAARYSALLLFIEAVMLLFICFKDRVITQNRLLRAMGAIFFAASFIPFFYEKWQTILLLGWGTESTSLAIIGAVMLYTKKREWFLLIPIPLLFCILSFLMNLYLF
jgi:hypothetical protein